MSRKSGIIGEQLPFFSLGAVSCCFFVMRFLVMFTCAHVEKLIRGTCLIA